MTKSNIEFLIDSIKENIVQDIAAQLSSQQLEDAKEHLTAQREALIDLKNFTTDGLEMARINTDLSLLKNLLTKVNKAISSRPALKKQSNQPTAKSDSDFSFTYIFYQVAQRVLNAEQFQELRDLTAKQVSKKHPNNAA